MSMEIGVKNRKQLPTDRRTDMQSVCGQHFSRSRGDSSRDVKAKKSSFLETSCVFGMITGTRQSVVPIRPGKEGTGEGGPG